MGKKAPIKRFTGAWGALERFTDRTMPLWLILLGIMILLENPFWTIVSLSEFEPWAGILDSVILSFFILDLIFKWFSVRHWKQFLKHYWIDIIAVFPFYLLFRAWFTISSLLKMGEDLGEGQRLLHEFLLLRETELLREARLVREAELIKEAGPLTRGVQTVERFFRFAADRDLEKKDAAIHRSPGSKRLRRD